MAKKPENDPIAETIVIPDDALEGEQSPTVRVEGTDAAPTADPVALEAEAAASRVGPDGTPIPAGAPPVAGEQSVAAMWAAGAVESTNIADEPEPVIVHQVAGAGTADVGHFVGLGVEHVSVGGEDWTVDPETGLITGRA